MAIDALAIPFDITWQRLGFMGDMIERGFADDQMPAKWRSSAAIYGYLVPEVETAEAYPDHRVMYLKIAASITGWSPREDLGQYLRIRDDEPWAPDGNEADPGSSGGSDDPIQNAAQGTISDSAALGRTYWPCVAAIAQIAVYPRPEAGVADADYPYIVDFEPKRRELYEMVTATNEVLSGSSQNTNIRKGTTSTHSGDVTAQTSWKVPFVGETGVTARYGYSRESVNIETTDASTERRETAGRSTQLAQMYQLFSGYHVGTNRAVFVVFPRPHIVSESSQIENSLINGERRLEGTQDLFLIVQIPKSIPGVCVRVLLDLSHKTDGHTRPGRRYTTTRRRVAGCVNFGNDRLLPVIDPPPAVAPPRLEVIDEGEIGGWRSPDHAAMKTGRAARLGFADDYNLANAQLQRTLLGTAASGGYRPRPFAETATFYHLASEELVRAGATLEELNLAGYLEPGEKTTLAAAGIAKLGDLFVDNKTPGETPPVVATVRARVWKSIVSKAKQG